MINPDRFSSPDVFPFLDVISDPDPHDQFYLPKKIDSQQEAIDHLDGKAVDPRQDLAQVLNWMAQLFLTDRASCNLLLAKIAMPHASYRELEKLVGLKRTMISKRVNKLAASNTTLARFLGHQTPRAVSQRRRRRSA